MSVRDWYNEQVDDELMRRAKRLTESELRCYKILCEVIIEHAMRGGPGSPADDASTHARNEASSDPTS